MARQIFVRDSELERLRAVVEQHLEGRDGATAERLGAELDRAVVVDAARMPEDAVTIESRVRFVEERSGTVREVVLVYPSDANASAGRVSVLAPVGAALLGLRPGDRIEWPLPDGRTAKLRIEAVASPRATGDESAA